MPFNNDDYVDVAERVQQFYAKYPDGRLSTTLVKFCQWPKDGIFAQAEAARTPDDPKPGVGSAWEPVPGPTAFTRDSEVQNAETAAWGRAIAAVGIKTKKIASKDEVRSRRAAAESKPDYQPPKSILEVSEGDAAKVITKPQQKRLWTIARQDAGLSDAAVKNIVMAVTGQESTGQIPRHLYDEVISQILGAAA